MNETFEQEVLSSSAGSKFLLAMLAMVSLFIAIVYIDSLPETDDLITLAVKASDTPDHIPGSKYQSTRYSLKAQEFNCRFWIADDAYRLIRNNITLKERLENIKRGDSLKITIYKAEETKINSLYFEATVVGLAIGDQWIFIPQKVRQINKDSRYSTLRIAWGVWFAILILLAIVLFIKKLQ